MPCAAILTLEVFWTDKMALGFGRADDYFRENNFRPTVTLPLPKALKAVN
jgi:hypothetical protein